MQSSETEMRHIQNNVQKKLWNHIFWRILVIRKFCALAPASWAVWQILNMKPEQVGNFVILQKFACEITYGELIFGKF